MRKIKEVLTVVALVVFAGYDEKKFNLTEYI